MVKLINIKGRLFDMQQPIVMGILNVTPDSFYGDSRKQSEKAIIAHVQQMLSEGAQIIDIGAQSTNPMSPLLSVEDEKGRLKSFMPQLIKEFPDVIFSVDTFYSEIARMCVDEFGVAIINDISGGQIDEKMFSTVAELRVPYVLMHMKGTPQTMTKETEYGDLVEDIFYYFSQKIEQLKQLGACDIIIDPGFGFSKTLNQNYELMAQLRNFHIFELPLLVGISRKSMIYKFLGISAEESLNGTTALHMHALLNGANILRAHDVKEAFEAISLFTKLQQAEPNS